MSDKPLTASKFYLFRVIGSGRPDSSHFKFRLECLNNGKQLNVTPKKLIRLYKEGRLKGRLPDRVKSLWGEKRKRRTTKLHSVFNEEGIFEIKS